MQRLTRTWLAAAIISSVLMGCCHEEELTRRPIWQSAPLSLTVSNQTESPITLRASSDSSQTDLKLASGVSDQIPFTAVIYEVSNESGEQVTEERGIESTSPFLIPAGADWSLRVSIADGEFESYLIELFDEWFTTGSSSRGLTVDIDGPAVAGLPANR